MDLVDANELRLWPLVHGSGTLYKNHENIKINGLKAHVGSDRKALNTFSYDISLKRNEYIFLAPARLSGGYGFGSFILIDPLVVIGNEGVKFLLRDIGDLISQIDIYLSGNSYTFPDWVIEPEIFENLIIAAFSTDSIENFKKSSKNLAKWVTDPNIKNRLYNSEQFKSYAEKYYLNSNKFFAAIENKSVELGFTFTNYLERNIMNWPYSEEILIPSEISPNLLLGYYNGNSWTKWNLSKNNEINIRTINFLDKLKNKGF